MDLWRRLKDAIAGGMRQRVTLAGFGYSAAIAVVCALAFASGNNLLFLLLALMIGMLLVSGFISRLSLAGLELDCEFPEHLPARRDAPARIKLHNDKSWMPSFSIHVSGAPGSAYASRVYFPMLPGGSIVEETVQVRFTRRGPHRRNSFVLHSRFPFGFAERRVQVTLGREVLVYPCLDPQPGFEGILTQLEGYIEQQTRGRGSDFYRIRPYEALESARHVDWRASAHTGELQVREFTREQEPLVDIWLDLDVLPSDAPLFENTIDCCAYLTWEIARHGARVRFRTAEFDVTVPTQADAYTILRYLAVVEPRRGQSAFEASSPENIQVIFAPDAARLSSLPGGNVVVVDISRFRPSPEPTGASPNQPRARKS